MSNTFVKDLVTLLAAETVAKPMMQFAGDTASAFFGQRSPGPTGPNVGEGQSAGLGGAVRDAVYNQLTDQGQTAYGDVLTSMGKERRVADEQGVRKVYQNPNPTKGDSTTDYLTAITKSSDNPAANFLYSNPETVANIVGLAAPAAAAVGTGYLAGGLFGGSKPRSDYALAIQGNPYLGGTGNANVDAAQASAYYQQQTAQMKFEHQMALQQARQQAQTPGIQNYGGGVSGSIPGIDADLAQVGRSIFGTGLRA